MRALLVDDEPLARKELRRLLRANPGIEIVGEAKNIDEAEVLLERLTPDLLFLDIEMPGGTGFDLLARLERVPQLIFTTAYAQHAVRAFEVNAVDYLLKPIEPERLATALQRVQQRAQANSRSNQNSNPANSNAASSAPSADAAREQPLEQLFVRDGERCWLVPLREVRLLASEGNYVRLHWNDAQPMLGRSLVNLEPRLDSRRFFRANRQQLINLEFVQSVELGTGGLLHVQLRGGPEVEISRRQARLFRARMSV